MKFMRHPMKFTLLVSTLLAIVFLEPAFAREMTKVGKMKMEKVEIVTKLGGQVPLDIPFLDESGKEVPIGSFLNRPTLLTLIYLTCQHTCPMLLNGVASLLGESKLLPGKDYDVITVSFDETDTPDLAAKKKGNYLKAVGKPFPPDAWHFLTGSAKSIAALTESVGFHFKRDRGGFTHPVSLIVLSREGKVVRYLDGVRFLPFDLEMAVTEATGGRTGSVVRRAMLYCFSYDPAGKRYVLDILKVVGIVTVIVAIAMISFLTITSRKYRNKRGG